MIKLVKLSDKRYEVFLDNGDCLGDFSRNEVGVDPFRFFPIQFRYNIAWTSALLRALSDALSNTNATTTEATMKTDKNLKDFWIEQAAWSEKTFGPTSERGPLGPLKHLAKEVQEVIKDPSDLMEFVDCLFLVLDATRRAGFTYDQLVEGAFKKLDINKARVWKTTGNPDEPIEHDRSKD